MPTYCYGCEKCGVEFEVEHGVEDDGPAACECGGELRKLLYATPGWLRENVRE